MTYTFKLSRRLARSRALLLLTALLSTAGCSSSDAFDPGSTAPTDRTPDTPALASSFAGGIPMGLFHLPTTDYGSRYNGGMMTPSPTYLVRDLSDIRSRGGKVLLNLAGSQKYFLDGSGHFSLSEWKARVDRFRDLNLSTYIQDGTIIGHYLIDEPYDAANFNGQKVDGATLEAMAKYSKQIWPDMPTIVRGEPYLIQWSGTYQYLDAAWAQYLLRKGNVGDYIEKNVSAAKQMGLALVVGLNIPGGGTNNRYMTPAQVQDWGSALLKSSYPCAFVSWKYEDDVVNTSAMKDAMDNLRRQAENRSTVACRTGGTSAPPPPPPPPPSDTTDPTPPPEASSSVLPFGLAYAPSSAYAGEWTGSVYKADPAELVSRLDVARGENIKVIVMLAQKGQVRNTDGTFSLTKWKSQVDRYRTLSLGNHITNRTFYLHFLVDQPHCASCWGGTAIPWSTVEAMAQYSKSIWPNLATTVRTAPTVLANASFRWNYLDAGWAQYNTRQGTVKTYLAAQVAAAKNEGLGLVAGLNLQDASGYGTAPMTASQIKEFGTVLASSPSTCALAGWKYDGTYLGQTGIRAALDSVASLASHRTAGSCVVE